jgi:hypothetical protein
LDAVPEGLLRVRLTHFYHVFADGDWRAPARDHFAALEKSNLIEHLDSIRLGIVGSKPNREQVKTELPGVVVAESETGWEQVTLTKAHHFAQSDDGAIFYAHTKGAFALSEFAARWRVSMIHDTVTGWRECVEALDEVDAVGSYWLKSWEPEHSDHGFFFAGNFWWAQSAYLRKLDPVKNDHRYQAEGWIGLGNPSVRVIREGSATWGNFGGLE